MLIDSSFFKGTLLIPNLDKATVQALVDWYINQYETRFLKEVLGITLYDAFIAGAFTDGVLIDPVPAPWLKLVSGDSTTDWKGLVYQPGPNPDYKKSPIANYVYYWFMYNTQTQSTGIGEVKANSENAIAADAGPKMVQAWNEMSEDVSTLWSYLGVNSTVYTDWQSTHRYQKYRQFRRINEFNI